MTRPSFQFTVGRLLASVGLLCVALGLLMAFLDPAGDKHGLLIPTIVMFVATCGQMFGLPVLAVVMTAVVAFVTFPVWLVVAVFCGWID